ncbi:HTH-type transcriptional regulator BetI [subsurface metagenome]
MSPKIVDKEKRKREIVFIALDVFAEKGFDGASIRDISEKANMAKGSVYDYFESKNDLILYALKVWINLIKEKGNRRTQKITDPVKRLKLMLTGLVDDFLLDKRMIKLSNAIYQLLMSEKVSLKQRKNFYRATIGPGKESLVKIFEDGVRKGIFKESLLKEGPELAVSMLACLDGIGFYYHINKNEQEMKKQTETYLKYMLAGIKK